MTASREIKTREKNLGNKTIELCDSRKTTTGTYTPPKWTCAAVLNVLRKTRQKSSKNCEKTRGYQFEMSNMGGSQIARENHILGESQRKQKIKIEMKPQNNVSKSVVKCVVSQ